ncbi:hypothetical protein ACH5RR_022554, partial [Cinchona calisaya]
VWERVMEHGVPLLRRNLVQCKSVISNAAQRLANDVEWSGSSPAVNFNDFQEAQKCSDCADFYSLGHSRPRLGKHANLGLRRTLDSATFGSDVLDYYLLQIDMKAEYIPPREDVILHNEAPDEVYIIVRGEGDIITCEMEKDGSHLDFKIRRHVWRSSNTGNAAFLDELLKDGLDPHVGESQGRMLLHKLSSVSLNEMLQNRELGHRITVPGTLDRPNALMCNEEKHECSLLGSSEGSCSSRVSIIRVSINRGHPAIRRVHCSEPGRLIRLPKSLTGPKSIAGEKFGFGATNAVVINEGAEIDSIELIRDNDKIFIIDQGPNSLM